MSQSIFNQVCSDPTIVKGIYNTCDQWCMVLLGDRALSGLSV